VTRAREIRDAVPSASLVGVFKNQPLTDVVDTALACELDLIQLHVWRVPRTATTFFGVCASRSLKAFHAVRMPAGTDLAAFRTTSYFLFDFDRVLRRMPRCLTVRGATLPARAARLSCSSRADRRIQRARNSSAHAFAVDVCRGVERSPGVKDPDSITRFIAEARS
jgi:phosphoribosylanthranilate isomerase